MMFSDSVTYSLEMKHLIVFPQNPSRTEIVYGGRNYTLSHYCTVTSVITQNLVKRHIFMSFYQFIFQLLSVLMISIIYYD